MTGRSDHLAARAEEAADISLGSAQVAVKAAGKAMDAMPTPDPRDDPNFQRLAGLEQSFVARLSPRHRNRWPELVAIDERLDDLDRRQQELHDRLADLNQRRSEADADYAQRMATWMAAGQPDPKPLSEAAALDDAIVEATAEHAAIDRLREGVLVERIAFVEKHRKRLVRDAEQETERARDRYLEAIAEAERARADLIGLNETRVWASLYPSDLLVTMVPTQALAAGRRRESQAHGFTAAVPAAQVFDLLRDDANVFTTISTRDQAAAMQGTTTAALTGDEAMWAGSDEDREFQRRERERQIADYERQWGRKPPEFQRY